MNSDFYLEARFRDDLSKFTPARAPEMTLLVVEPASHEEKAGWFAAGGNVVPWGCLLCSLRQIRLHCTLRPLPGCVLEQTTAVHKKQTGNFSQYLTYLSAVHVEKAAKHLIHGVVSSSEQEIAECANE